MLDDASRTHGRRIWLLSDEPYRRIRFDGIEFASPAGSYPWTVIDYSYGKVLLAPGQRLGYLALSPLVPAAEREELRAAFMPLGLAIGWGFPDAVMQYSVPALETLSLDMAELTRKRDRMYGALTDGRLRDHPARGHVLPLGQGAGGDARAFCDALEARGVYVMPGTLFDQPHHFRISLTATMATIERAIPHLLEVAAEFGRDA